MSIFDAVSDWIHDLLGGTKSTDLADLGADPDQVVGGGAPAGGAFPNSGGSSVIDQVNESVAKATQAHDEGMEIAKDAPQMPSAGQQAQGFIDGVMKASPEQLSHMEGTLGALAESGEISNSVGEAHHELLNSNAAHEAVRAANSEEIQAKSVAAAAQKAIDDAKDAT